LKVPVIGILMRKIAVARLPAPWHLDLQRRTILEGLDITARTAGNAVVERALLKVRRALEEANRLPSRCVKPTFFPAWLRR